VEYSKGDRPEARSAAFVIDTVAPTARIGATETLFSPDGDGRKDGVAIEQESSDEEVWEAEISDSDGTVVRTEFWRGVARNFIWDGKDDDGSIVPDGSYRYQLTATDSAGNSISRAIPEIRVDTRVASAFISLRATEITPNNDGERDTVRMNLYPSLTEGIIEWSLVILDENGRSVRNLTSGSQRAVPATVTWDGRRDDRRIVDGEYTPRLTIEYEKGNLVDARSSEPILLDLSGPTFRLGTSPTPFSPDDDGENDVVRIAMSGVNDANRIVDWRIDIFDPRGNPFYQRSGSGRPPASIQWDGYSSDGELVQAAEDYLVQASLTDALGNVGEHTVILPIDVLVLRDGVNLKIRISSIQFAPNSADFLGFDEEKAARNLRTLTRLAEILRKYASYEIRIEGHAVSVYWDDAARASREETEELAPLSKARADAVKSGLVDLGIPAEQMTTVGMGGTQPLVPHSDLENRWKSRRVEFILIR
jgi:outer membrane protein OmpA-like peptidoglycan-associated protein/flagellar hook assembly protein FlgD